MMKNRGFAVTEFGTKTFLKLKFLLLHGANSNTAAGRDWGQEEKGMTEDEMAGWHH